MSDSLPSYKSPQDVYARYLISHRGYPLWFPEPNSELPDDYVRDGLRIGDLGVVSRDGSFDVLFNICLPADHPLHDDYGYGVPNGFEPISLRKSDIFVARFAEDHGSVISTSSVTQMKVDPAGGRSDYKFGLSSSEGALLILPEGASSHTLRNHLVFRDYALRHAPQWYKFAKDTAGRSIAEDSLYLITGFFKARSWSLASFQKVGTSGEFPAHFKAAQAEDGNIIGAYSWNTERAIDKRVGPTEYNGRSNQAVYISGFKIAVTDEALRRKRIAVMAGVPSIKDSEHEDFVKYIEEPEDSEGPCESTHSYSDQGNTQHANEHVSIQHTPDVLPPFHPSDLINRYLLRKEHSATIAITHDSQWAAILENGRLNIPDFTNERCLEKVLSEEYIVTLQDRNVYLQATSSAECISSLRDIDPSNIRDSSSEGPWTMADDKPMSMLTKVEEEGDFSHRNIWTVEDEKWTPMVGESRQFKEESPTDPMTQSIVAEASVPGICAQRASMLPVTAISPTPLPVTVSTQSMPAMGIPESTALKPDVKAKRGGLERTPGKVPPSPGTPQVVVGVKRPPEEDVAALAHAVPTELEALNATSSKKAKTFKWAGESSRAVFKKQKQKQAEGLETDEDATAFFDHDIAPPWVEIMVETAQEPAGAPTTAAALSVPGSEGAGRPPTDLPPHLGQFDHPFIDFIDFSCLEGGDSREPTPDLVPSTSSNPSPESDCDHPGNTASPDKFTIMDMEGRSDLLGLGFLRETDAYDPVYQAANWEWSTCKHPTGNGTS